MVLKPWLHPATTWFHACAMSSESAKVHANILSLDAQVLNAVKSPWGLYESTLLTIRPLKLYGSILCTLDPYSYMGPSYVH